MSLSRRSLLRGVAGAAGAAVAAPFVGVGRYRLFAWSDQEYTARCIELVRGSLVIDMLGLTTLNGDVRARWGPAFDGFTERDFADFRGSEIDVFHIARGVGGRNTEEAYRNVLSFVGSFNSVIANRPDVFVRIDSAADLASVQSSGRVGILIGVQDSTHFRSPEDVNQFHALGQRVSQLTYNARNLLGNGSTERVDGGISDFGVSNEALKANYKGSYAFRDKIDIDDIAHPQRMFDVTEGLIRRGYADEHIRGILGGNFQRALGEIWGG